MSPSFLRCELKMPVLDAITLVDFFHSAVTDHPVFGIDFNRVADDPAVEEAAAEACLSLQMVGPVAA